MMDRLDKAWALRRDVHAWVKENPDCGMRAIGAAFIDTNYDTIRFAVSRLRRLGLMYISARSKTSVYRAFGEFNEMQNATRDKLREGGRKMGADNGRKSARKRMQDTDPGTADSWRHYTNRPDRRRPYQNQRGQGAAA